MINHCENCEFAEQCEMDSFKNNLKRCRNKPSQLEGELKKQKSPLDTVIKLLAFMLISLFVVFVLTVLEKNATIREQKAQIANLQDTLKLYHDYIIRLEEEK